MKQCKNAPLRALLSVMDMRTDLTAVPHAGLGYHFLRVYTCTNPWSLEVVKKKGGQRLKTRSVRQVDGVPCVTAATLGTLSWRFWAWLHAIRKETQVRHWTSPVISVPPQKPLRWTVTSVGETVPLPKNEKTSAIRLDPCDYKGHTHTHTPPQREASGRFRNP